MTMNRPFEEILQRFPDLLTVGMEMQVTVIPSSGDEIRVKTLGGCFGILSSGYSFPVGTLITAQVADIQNGVPVFEPSDEWLMTRTPQKGRVVFSTPLGVVIELAENVYAAYQPAQGLSAELKDLKERQEVIVCGLTKMSDGAYTAQTLQIVSEAEKPQPEDPMAPWDEKKITDVVAQGSRKVLGQAKLGKVITVDVTGSKAAQMSKGGMVTLREGYFPRGIARAFVRVVFIPQDGQPQVEFVKADNPKPEKPAPKAFVAKAENTTAVGQCDEKIAREAQANGSLWFAGPSSVNAIYRLGYAYKVRMGENAPVFNLDLHRDFSFEVLIDEGLEQDIPCGSEIVCRVKYIGFTEKNNRKAYTLHVSILEVL